MGGPGEGRERGNFCHCPATARAHLDDVNRAPEGEVRLRVLRFVVLAVVAALAARALLRNKRAVAAGLAAAAS